MVSFSLVSRYGGAIFFLAGADFEVFSSVGSQQLIPFLLHAQNFDFKKNRFRVLFESQFIDVKCEAPSNRRTQIIVQ
jgi:hypothetical protein